MRLFSSSQGAMYCKRGTKRKPTTVRGTITRGWYKRKGEVMQVGDFYMYMIEITDFYYDGEKWIPNYYRKGRVYRLTKIDGGRFSFDEDVGAFDSIKSFTPIPEYKFLRNLKQLRQ